MSTVSDDYTRQLMDEAILKAAAAVNNLLVIAQQAGLSDVDTVGRLETELRWRRSGNLRGALLQGLADELGLPLRELFADRRAYDSLHRATRAKLDGIVARARTNRA